MENADASYDEKPCGKVIEECGIANNIYEDDPVPALRSFSRC